MAGRNYHPLPSSSTGAVTEDHIIRHRHPHLEDRIAIQKREIQALLLDNQRLAATHVALKQNLVLAQQEVRHLSAAADTVKSERDVEVREVYERSLNLDAQARAVDAMSAELAHVRADIKKFTVDRLELKAELEAVNDELARARAEAKQVPVIKSEIEALRKEIQKGRSAIELEKKTRGSNLEQRQILEKNLTLVAQEMDKLHAELAKARTAAANPSTEYNGSYGTDVARLNSYPDIYSNPRANGGQQFVPGTMVMVPLEGQGSHTPYENQTGAIPNASSETRVLKL